MAKEVTLENLVGEQREQKVIKTIDNSSAAREEAEREEQEMVFSSLENAKPISTKDLSKKMEELHPEEFNKEVVTDSPLVTDAFESMYKTVEERKKRFEEEFLPVIEQNARELELERELGMTDEEILKEMQEEDAMKLAEANKEEDVKEEILIEEFEDDDLVEEEPQVEEVVREEPKPVKVTKPEPELSNISYLDERNITKEESDEELDLLLSELEEDNSSIIEEEEESLDDTRERLKDSLQSIKVTKTDLDLSVFSIAEPVSFHNILKAVPKQTKKYADFPLVHTGRNMRFEECTGPEIETLSKTISNSSPINGILSTLRFIYDHTLDANKQTFELWTQSIRAEDIESLYFGVYKATYGDSNIIPYIDNGKDGCGKTFMINVDVNDMIKFKDDEAKELYDSLKNADTTTPGKMIKSNLIAISDTYAISYKEPTLYDTFVQFATLKSNIREKFMDHLNTLAYIDGFYIINKEDSTLVPIDYPKYKNNISKTVISKLKVYTEIIKNLTSDQYNIMVATIDSIIDESKITFVQPKCECTECGHVIEEAPIVSITDMLFTRAQSVRIKSL